MKSFSQKCSCVSSLNLLTHAKQLSACVAHTKHVIQTELAVKGLYGDVSCGDMVGVQVHIENNSCGCFEVGDMLQVYVAPFGNTV